MPLRAALRATLAQRSAEPLVVAPQGRFGRADLARDMRRAIDALATARIGSAAIVGLDAPGGPAFLAGFAALVETGRPALLLDAAAPEAGRATALGAAALLRPRGDGWEVEPLGGSAALPDMAVIKLSSGTTGDPRGIALTGGAVRADTLALQGAMRLGEHERLLAGIPWSHSYGFSLLPLGALLCGHTLVLPGAEGDCPPSVLPTVPAYIQGLVARATAPEWPASLATVVTAGAPLPPATARAFRLRFGRPVHVFYGASECGGICYDASGNAGERGTVGRPIDGVTVELEAGRVVVRSPAVATRYWPDADPRLAGGRFSTGDLGEWREGELALTGRADDWINVDGRKVNPREVERVLLALEGVEDACVVGEAAEARAKRTVRAFIACAAGRLDYERVQRWCRDRLASYKVPRSVVWVREIPRTPRGKPDRRALEALR